MTSDTQATSISGAKRKGRTPLPVEVRFWRMVERRSPDECWEWTGSAYGEGYGGFMLHIDGKHRCIGAHRVAYGLAHGVPPQGIWVLHRCDNRRCCNPGHLFLGDHDANMADMASKGRSCAHLRPEQAVAIRGLAAHAGWSVKRLAAHFKVSREVVYGIVGRRSYRHVGRDLTREEIVGR